MVVSALRKKSDFGIERSGGVLLDSLYDTEGEDMRGGIVVSLGSEANIPDSSHSLGRSGVVRRVIYE